MALLYITLTLHSTECYSAKCLYAKSRGANQRFLDFDILLLIFSPISHVRFFVGTFQTVFPRLQQVRSDFRRRLEQPEVFVVAQKIVSLAENQRRPVEIVFYSREPL